MGACHACLTFQRAARLGRPMPIRRAAGMGTRPRAARSASRAYQRREPSAERELLPTSTQQKPGPKPLISDHVKTWYPNVVGRAGGDAMDTEGLACPTCRGANPEPRPAVAPAQVFYVQAMQENQRAARLRAAPFLCARAPMINPPQKAIQMTVTLGQPIQAPLQSQEGSQETGNEAKRAGAGNGGAGGGNGHRGLGRRWLTTMVLPTAMVDEAIPAPVVVALVGIAGVLMDMVELWRTCDVAVVSEAELDVVVGVRRDSVSVLVPVVMVTTEALGWAVVCVAVVCVVLEDWLPLP